MGRWQGSKDSVAGNFGKRRMVLSQIWHDHTENIQQVASASCGSFRFEIWRSSKTFWPKIGFVESLDRSRPSRGSRSASFSGWTASWDQCYKTIFALQDNWSRVWRIGSSSLVGSYNWQYQLGGYLQLAIAVWYVATIDSSSLVGSYYWK